MTDKPKITESAGEVVAVGIDAAAYDLSLSDDEILDLWAETDRPVQQGEGAHVLKFARELLGRKGKSK